jgi:hypothetical protein
LSVEQHAAQVQDELGAVAAPTHTRAVETHAHEVAHGAFYGASADVEVIPTQLGTGRIDA